MILRLLPSTGLAAVALVLAFVPAPGRAVQPPPREAPPAEPPPTATVVYRNLTLYTAAAGADAPIPNAVLIVKDGKVLYAGPAAAAPAQPADPEVRDLAGAVVIPGLVDTHSHIGLFGRPGVGANADGNEMSGPVQPGVRALDSINPDDPGIRMAVAGGVTTANIMPGSGNVIGGQTLYVKLRGRTVEQMVILGRLPDGSIILGGLKMANGENPKGYGRNRSQAPFTRMKVAALQREQFVKAREYKAKRDAGEKVEPNLDLEPLVEVLEKKRTVHFHCHRADDLMTAVRISEEFGFELVLQHATEGYRVADILAKKRIPVSLTLIDSPGGKPETIGLLEENAAVLAKAGVTVTINTDDSITESRFYLRTGAIALRGGLPEMDALRALTSNAAKLLHLDHRLGSLEKGKDADFVVLSGPPFSTYTQVLETHIDGRKRFDRSKKADWVYQAGGFALPDAAKELPAPFAPTAAPKAGPKVNVLEGREPNNSKKLVVLAGRIHTAAGPPIDGGSLLIVNGKIAAVLRGDPQIPADATVLTAKEVTPGLIDPFTTAGLSGAWNLPQDQDQDEPSDPNQSDLRALDGFNAKEPLLDFLRAQGTTIVHSTPGRVNPIAGRGGVFRSDGMTAEGAALVPVGAVIVNLGEEPKAAKGKAPGTRMATAALVRRAFADAKAYGAKRAADAKTPQNAKHEGLLPALAGKVPVFFAAHRADDIATALRLADEFKLKPVLALGTEAYRLVPELKKAGIPVVVHPTMQRAASSLETMHGYVGNAAVLADAGIPVSLCTGFEGYVPKVRVLRFEAAMAAANGLGHDRALKAITVEPAKLLGIADRFGTIEVGKAADLVLYDGDPFEHATHVTHTVVGGRVAYSRAEYLALPFERRILPLLGGGPGAGCCLEGW
ncbi:amidohydrolase family protein [Urbifossiella limnaea]|uniref:Imidazolonepropionase n=1 Tax=Urbifossiella limnaea TaxID=2528023 RepID=A0A517XLI0_9BACT|nr:amidohydrolase family protein [Urbifossiella limnaea]QDU18367.1 imidazolonepropionase [Urbifossiella limnaea]